MFGWKTDNCDVIRKCGPELVYNMVYRGWYTKDPDILRLGLDVPWGKAIYGGRGTRNSCVEILFSEKSGFSFEFIPREFYTLPNTDYPFILTMCKHGFITEDPELIKISNVRG